MWWCSCQKEDSQNILSPNQWLGRCLKVSRVLRLFQGVGGGDFSPCLLRVDWKKVVLLYQGVFEPDIEYMEHENSSKEEVPGHLSEAGRTNFSQDGPDRLDFPSGQEEGVGCFLWSPGA